MGGFFPIGQSGEARPWRVCYQRGLPRLVSLVCGILFKYLYDVKLKHSSITLYIVDIYAVFEG